MGKILEPNIPVEDIIIQANEEDDYNVGRQMNELGYSIPLVKINEFVLDFGTVQTLNVTVSLYGIPTFRMVIDDANSRIQAALTNKEDKCIIFIGTKDFYIKFNGLITNIDTTNRNNLILNGIFYVKELFNSKQIAFNNKSVTEILTELCTNTKLGLYTYDNQTLNVIVENYLLPNVNYITGINNIIEGYTDNLWAIDTFGYLHLGTVTSILEKPVDKYTLDPKTQKQLDSEKDMLFVFGRRLDENEEEIEDENNRYKYAIEPENVKIESNFSMTKIDTATLYKVFDGKYNEKILDANINIGIESIDAENTFSGFLNSKFPLRNERINKLMYGNVITMELRQLMYEIVPFSVVELEIYLEGSAEANKYPIKKDEYSTDGPTDEIDIDADGNPKEAFPKLDEIHSGKHFVTGYTYNYRKRRSNKQQQNYITQTVYLI